MSVETVFAKLTGRDASPEERERLYRLRDALGLRDNDAFWSIVMALEYYDSLLRQYPAQVAQEAARTIERARAAFAAAAEKEAAHLQRALSTRVAETSLEIARRRAERPVGLHQITLLFAAAVAFGALCVHAGYDLASTDGPWHAERASDLHGAKRALACVLSIPAGWMIFVFLVPAAVRGAQAGWILAVDPLADWRDKAVGGCFTALCIAGAVACAALVARVT